MITSLTLSTRGGCRTSYYPPAILLELLEGALLLATLVDFLAESPFLLFGWVKGESRLSFSDSNGITVFYIGQLAPPPREHGDQDDVVLYSISTSALDPCETAYQATARPRRHLSLRPRLNVAVKTHYWPTGSRPHLRRRLWQGRGGRRHG